MSKGTLVSIAPQKAKRINPRLWVAAISICAGIVAVVLLLRGRSGEPQFAGKPLSEWLAIASTNHRAAVYAVQQIGTNALPFAVQWIKAEPPVWKHKLSFWIFNHPSFIPPSPLWHWLNDDELVSRKENARVVLHFLGTNAVAAIPELVRVSHEGASEVRYQALEALGSMGTNAFPQLLGMLRDSRNVERGTCARILGEIIRQSPSAGEGASPVLALCLEDTDPILVIRCSEAVDHPGINLAVVIPALIHNLSSTELLIRIAATNTLEDLAPQVLAEKR